jgi:hypothetical protein
VQYIITPALKYVTNERTNIGAKLFFPNKSASKRQELVLVQLEINQLACHRRRRRRVAVSGKKKGERACTYARGTYIERGV